MKRYAFAPTAFRRFCFIRAIVFPYSGVPKIPDPETITFAPAAATIADVVRLDPAVDLDVDVDARAGELGAEQLDLAERGRQERLAAEAGVDAHEEDHVHVGQDPFHGGERRGGIECDARLLPELADARDDALEVGGRLGVDGEDVGPRLREVVEVPLRLRDHQVDIEGRGGRFPDRRHDRRADGDVGDEPAVHHVDVEQVGARLLHRPDLFGQAAEVGR